MALDPVYAAMVAVGGAAGACLRASLYVVAARAFKTSSWVEYPYGTFVANALGSLVLGLLTGLALSLHVPSVVRDLVGTGFCGSLTTFSTFSSDSLSLFEKQRWHQLTVHIGTNLVLGFGAAAVGYYLGKHW